MIDDPAFKVLMTNAEALKRGALAMWTIYDKPTDHPDGYIARLHEVAEGGPVATDKTLVGGLEHIRDIFLRAGLIKLAREPADEPQIVETWV